jgi:hypothetical protein
VQRDELYATLQACKDVSQRKTLHTQLDKCDAKIQSLTTTMLFYCSGLQSCMDDMEHARFPSDPLLISDVTVQEEAEEGEDALHLHAIVPHPPSLLAPEICHGDGLSNEQDYVPVPADDSDSVGGIEFHADLTPTNNPAAIRYEPDQPGTDESETNTDDSTNINDKVNMLDAELEAGAVTMQGRHDNQGINSGRDLAIEAVVRNGQQPLASITPEAELPETHVVDTKVKVLPARARQDIPRDDNENASGGNTTDEGEDDTKSEHTASDNDNVSISSKTSTKSKGSSRKRFNLFGRKNNKHLATSSEFVHTADSQSQQLMRTNLSDMADEVRNSSEDDGGYKALDHHQHVATTAAEAATASNDDYSTDDSDIAADILREVGVNHLPSDKRL